MARKIDPEISLDLGTLPVFLAGLQNTDRRTAAASGAPESVARFPALHPHWPGPRRGDADKGVNAIGTAGTEPGPIHDAVVAGGFDTASPLWYYILREAEVQQNGNRLGSVGSRTVAETLSALVRRDGASYLNNLQDGAVKPNGIEVGGGTIIATIGDLLKFSGAPV